MSATEDGRRTGGAEGAGAASEGAGGASAGRSAGAEGAGGAPAGGGAAPEGAGGASAGESAGAEVAGASESARHGLAELIAQRRARAERLREQGVEIHPVRYPDVEPIADVKGAYEHLADGQETEEGHRVAGRIAARRGSGKAAFLDLVDRTGRIQLHARVDVLGPELFERLIALDLGDLLGVDGAAMRSRHGELTLRVDAYEILGKALRPPPDKHHGLSDVETRYRQRELDLIASEEARARFQVRAKIVSAIRAYLDGEGFVEVETPVLQPLYGGALARPFTTHHNALDRTFYLRIATELYLKRLIVGGLERVYELGKDFRNEGVSTRHNPEFTMVEWYEAYADYEDEAARLEQVLAGVARAIGYAGELDFASPWRRVRYVEAVREATGIGLAAGRDVGVGQDGVGGRGVAVGMGEGEGRVGGRDAGEGQGRAGGHGVGMGVGMGEGEDQGRVGGRDAGGTAGDDAARLAGRDAGALAEAIRARGLDVRTEGATWPQLADELMSKYVEPTLVQPTLVFDYPIELSPFARAHRSVPGLAERFEAYVAGMEVANAFSELTDPAEQRARFGAQRRLALAGDEETQPHDELFIQALEHGLPPTGGVGVGIDRLVMAFTGQRSIREVVLFPALRS